MTGPAASGWKTVIRGRPVTCQATSIRSRSRLTTGRATSPQPGNHAYLEKVAGDYDITRYIRFGVEVTEARFDETAGEWTVVTNEGGNAETLRRLN